MWRLSHWSSEWQIEISFSGSGFLIKTNRFPYPCPVDMSTSPAPLNKTKLKKCVFKNLFGSNIDWHLNIGKREIFYKLSNHQCSSPENCPIKTIIVVGYDDTLIAPRLAVTGTHKWWVEGRGVRGVEGGWEDSQHQLDFQLNRQNGQQFNKWPESCFDCILSTYNMTLLVRLVCHSLPGVWNI